MIVYLDNILIYSNSVAEHNNHVQQVLEKLCQHKLYAKPDKCEFETTCVEYLGFKVTPGGVTSDPKKIENIQKWSAPRTLKQLRGFLGFCNFYRRFVP